MQRFLEKSQMRTWVPLLTHPQLLRARFCILYVEDFRLMNIENKEQELRKPEVFQDAEGGGTPAGAAVSEALEEHRLTPAELEQLKEQAAKASEHWEQMLRVAADFENFKKRAARERQEFTRLQKDRDKQQQP